MNRYVLTKWHRQEFKDDVTRRLFLDRAGAHYTEHFITSLEETQKVGYAAT